MVLSTSSGSPPEAEEGGKMLSLPLSPSPSLSLSHTHTHTHTHTLTASHSIGASAQLPDCKCLLRLFYLQDINIPAYAQHGAAW